MWSWAEKPPCSVSFASLYVFFFSSCFMTYAFLSASHSSRSIPSWLILEIFKHREKLHFWQVRDNQIEYYPALECRQTMAGAKVNFLSHVTSLWLILFLPEVGVTYCIVCQASKHFPCFIALGRGDTLPSHKSSYLALCIFCLGGISWYRTVVNVFFLSVI